MHAECAQEIIDLLNATPVGGRERQYQVVVAHCEAVVGGTAEEDFSDEPPADETSDETPETPELSTE